MSSPKKKRRTSQPLFKEKRHPRESQHEVDPSIKLGFVKLDIQSEVRYIAQLAQAADARLIVLGPFVLFSTQTRDAWLLDREDNFAFCVCREGKPQPFQIISTSSQFCIEWPATFAIEGETFIVRDRQSGKVTKIDGYPTDDISLHVEVDKR